LQNQFLVPYLILTLLVEAKSVVLLLLKKLMMNNTAMDPDYIFIPLVASQTMKQNVLQKHVKIIIQD